MERESITSEVTELISQSMIEQEHFAEVNDNTRFIEDLGFGSVNSIMLITLLSDKLGVDITEHAPRLLKIRLVGELVDFLCELKQV